MIILKDITKKELKALSYELHLICYMLINGNKQEKKEYKKKYIEMTTEKYVKNIKI
jgi:hypothetical protein